MAELVKIPAASAEYVAKFDRPYIGLLVGDRPAVFEGILNALLPFNFRFANTEVVNSDVPADNRVVFRIPERGVTFQFGAEEYRFNKDGSSWINAEEDSKLWAAAERALLDNSSARVASSTLTFAMHLQPLAKTRDQLLAGFIPPPFLSLATEKGVQSVASHIKFGGGEILLDYSLAYANGVFLRLSSIFQGHPTQAEMLARMTADQERVFKILDIQEAGTAS